MPIRSRDSIYFPVSRVRVLLLNAALGPLDYRAPEGTAVEPGSIVVAPLGPRQLTGVVWEADRLPTEEVDAGRLRPLAGAYDLPPIAEPLRRLVEWTADYYLSPLAAVLRMVLPSSSALEGSRQLTEYRPTGLRPIFLDKFAKRGIELPAGIFTQRPTPTNVADLRR